MAPHPLLLIKNWHAPSHLQARLFYESSVWGNPAAVVLFKAFPDDSMMLAVAAENNLAETAFLVPEGDDFRVRWFTPRVEVPLCGHATLASAALVLERLQPGRAQVSFQSASGPLTVRRSSAGYSMDFPARSSTLT